MTTSLLVRCNANNVSTSQDSSGYILEKIGDQNKTWKIKGSRRGSPAQTASRQSRVGVGLGLAIISLFLLNARSIIVV